jgi:hypothetical protein
VTDQSNDSVAIGHSAGQTSQGTQCVAIGHQAGQISQGIHSVAVGYYSGVTNQGYYTVAVGRNAAHENQGEGAVAVGNAAGNTSQGTLSVAVGYFAGYDMQGTESVAVGHKAGETNQGQADNSIVLNAQNTQLNSTTSGFFVKPVREQENTVGWTPPGTLWYDSSTGELASQPDVSQGTITVDLTVSGELGVSQSVTIGNQGGTSLTPSSANGLIINNGDTITLSEELSQIKFGFYQNGFYTHDIVTTHSDVSTSGNTIQFFLHDASGGISAEYPNKKEGLIIADGEVFIPNDLFVNGDSEMSGDLSVGGTVTPFTGGHTTIVIDDISHQDVDGFILSSTGKPLLNPTNYNYLMYTQLSQTSNDSKCAGVYRHPNKINKHGICVAIGEGTLWVCEENGPITNGDYITTSSIPGIGMRQDSTQLHNYTVAKAYTNCDFNPLIQTYSVPKMGIVTSTETRNKMTTRTISESYEEVIETSGYVSIPTVDSFGNNVYEDKWFDKIMKKITKYRNKNVTIPVTIDTKIPILNQDGTFKTFETVTTYVKETVTVSKNGQITDEAGMPVMEDVSKEIYQRKWAVVFGDKYVIYNDEAKTDVYLEYPFSFSTYHPSMVGNTYRCARIGCTYHCG